jgi:peroxiredoxin
VATRAKPSAAPQVGDLAPPLQLSTIDGSGFRLEDERGRPVLLTFLRHAG